MSLRRAGEMISVDGVVHRRTSDPTLHLVCDGWHGTRLRPGTAVATSFVWTLGCGLSSDTGQGTMPRVQRRGFAERACLLLGEGALPRCASFPLGDVAQAVALGEAFAEVTASGRYGRFAPPPSPAVWSEPWAFPEDPVSTLRAAATMRVWAQVRRSDEHGNDVVEGHQAAESAHAALEDPSGTGGAVAVMEATDAASVRTGYADAAAETKAAMFVALCRAARITHDRTSAMDDVSDLRL